MENEIKQIHYRLVVLNWYCYYFRSLYFFAYSTQFINFHSNKKILIKIQFYSKTDENWRVYDTNPESISHRTMFSTFARSSVVSTKIHNSVTQILISTWKNLQISKTKFYFVFPPFTYSIKLHLMHFNIQIHTNQLCVKI